MAKASYTIELEIDDYGVPVSEFVLQMWLDAMLLANNCMPKSIKVKEKR